MRILKILAWLAGLLLLVFLVLLVAAPTRIHVERSIVIKAPAPRIWDYIVKFERFNEWNAWKSMDTAAQYTITGLDGTVGATLSWKGRKIGEGRLEHIALRPYTGVRQRLYFFKPWASVADVYFTLEGHDGQTTVTWGLDAGFDRPRNVLGGAMKGALENDYEKGLQQLKAAVERPEGNAAGPAQNDSLRRSGAR